MSSGVFKQTLQGNHLRVADAFLASFNAGLRSARAVEVDFALAVAAFVFLGALTSADDAGAVVEEREGVLPAFGLESFATVNAAAGSSWQVD